MELEDRVRSLEKDLRDEKDKSERMRLSNQDSEGKMRDLKSELGAQKVKVVQLEEEKKRLQEELDESRSLLYAEKARRDQYAKSEDRLAKTEKSAKRELINALTENNDLRMMVEEFQEKIKAYETAIGEIQGMLAEKDEDIKTFAADLADKEAEVADLTGQLEDRYGFSE